MRDQIGNDYAQRESSDGNVVTGVYRVLLPDSRVQVVKYMADDANGYTADVQYEGQATSGRGGGGGYDGDAGGYQGGGGGGYGGENIRVVQPELPEYHGFNTLSPSTILFYHCSIIQQPPPRL